MNSNEISRQISKLPNHLITEVLDYVEFLLHKYGHKEIDQNDSQNKFKFDWEGGLSKLKSQYTSVELQHKATEWR